MLLLWKFKNKNRIVSLQLTLGIEQQILMEKKTDIRKRQDIDCVDLKNKNRDWTKK